MNIANILLNTHYALEQLAADVRSIMLNQGGPVAARTVYSILRRTHQALRIRFNRFPVIITGVLIDKNNQGKRHAI